MRYDINNPNRYKGAIPLGATGTTRARAHLGRRALLQRGGVPFSTTQILPERNSPPQGLATLSQRPGARLPKETGIG
jgi:hypothetical protein